MGESENGLRARVFELYIVDEIKKGVLKFLRLFIDDGDIPSKMCKFSNEFIRRRFWTGWSKGIVKFTGLYSCMF
jgi:hypothetical protein